MAPKVLTGIGCFLFGISAIALAISIALPIVNGPRTSWEEAMMGIVPSAICTCFSLLPLGGGAAWLASSRRKGDAPSM